MEWNREVYRHRIRLILIITAVLWLFFLGRFFYLQIISHEDLSAAAAAQYDVQVRGMDSRGQIWDRNLQPLTGRSDRYYYFIPRDRIDSTAVRMLDSVSASDISSPEGAGSGYGVWETELYDETINRRLKEICGAYVLCLPSRYSSSQTACHLTGYLNEADQTGASGLEKAFENQLKSSENSLSLLADGSGRILASSAPVMQKEKKLSPSNLITTLDINLQQYCEKAMESRGVTGAVLVSDALTGEVLAWVSSPFFNPNAVETYLNQEGEELVNKCIQGMYPPGSVFKTVLAAAALEGGTVNPKQEYLCTGETEVEGIVLGCRTGPEGGHGMVNMEKAMAVSCNCYFAHLGERLGRQALLEMAARLGFGKTVMGIFQEESSGNLPEFEETSQQDISNLSIGQGVLLATPIQVHQMMSAVAAGGCRVPLTVIRSRGEPPSKYVFSEETAVQLQGMLEAVMEYGTGSSENWSCPVYGKTGTAEAARGGRMVKQCWFSGFCRTGGSTFVVTVLVEDGESGTASCLPVFRDIVEKLEISGPMAE